MTRTTLRRPRAAGKKSRRWALRSPGNLAGGGSALVATETWQGATSSEDEGSVRRYEHSDDSDVDAEGIETELTAAVPPTCKTFDASGSGVAKTSSSFSFATDVTWAYQNLRRVPPACGARSTPSGFGRWT